MKKKQLYFIFVFAFSILNTAYSQQVILDVGFNTHDDGVLGDGFDNAVRTVAIQADGKLIVGGDFLNLNGASTPKLCRLLADGSKDPLFAVGTSFDGNIYTTLIQPDGKIIVGGSFSSYNGFAAGKLIRLNTDGSRDTTFDTSIGSLTGIIYNIALQIDGSLIIAGSFTKYNSSTVNRIARILPNGNLDLTFITLGAGNGVINAVQIQPDGKIIIVGTFTLYNGSLANRIIRLNSNGSDDNSFNTGMGFDDDLRTLAIQSDGKIIVGGDFISYKGTTANRIARLDTDGTVDSSFVSGSGFSNGYISVIRLTALGGVMVGGSFTTDYNGTDVNRLVLLQANGVINPLFDVGTGPATAAVLTVAEESSGSWFLGGTFLIFDSQNQGRLAKIDAMGTQDVGFLPAGVGFDNSVLKVISLAGNKTMAFGNFTKFNGVNASRITRLSEDGRLDLSFNTLGSGSNNFIKTAALQNDGKIVFAGNFTSYNGITMSRICRIVADGAIDPTFVIGTGFNSQVYALALQGDGKIVVVGNFTKYDGTNCNRVVRLFANGTIDTSFDIGLGADAIVETILIQPDGKILLGGRFSTYNGNSYNRLVRLNTNGSIDSSFIIGTGFDKNVYALALQSDNKIIIGGTFLNYNGTSAKRILRLNSNGTFDTDFLIGNGFSKGEIRAILVQPDNRLLIGGTFTGTYNGILVKRMVRLHSNGVFDTSFTVDLNSTLFSISVTLDAKVIIAGNFNSVSGITKHRIARLKFCIDSSVWNGSSWSNGLPSIGKALIFNDDYTILSSTNSCSCSISAGNTVTVKTGNTLGLSADYSGLGTLILENNASLYQSDDAIINTGIINLKRESAPILKFDYTFWSSAVSNQRLVDVSPNTLSDKFYSYDAVANSWFIEQSTNRMQIGKGYTIRGPQEFSTMVPALYEAVFIGVPNNGKVSIPIASNGSSNLIGNPYPSAINADVFIAVNSGVLDGTLYFWTHNTPITNNIYTTNDYAVYNLMGGVGTRAAINSGVNNTKPDGKIASGQAFFTTSINNAGTVVFDNSMRIVEQNSTFFKFSPTKKSKSNAIEKHRVWLNLSNSEGAFKQVLIGYAANATNEFDHFFDGETFDGNEYVDFYSINKQKKLVIQGRSLPFDSNDSVPLGYKSNIEGNFNIAIDLTDGLFTDHNIYIEDQQLNVLHDLKRAPYSFNTLSGQFDNRFVLRYTSKVLEINDFDSLSNLILIYKDKNELKIKSQIEIIKRITFFDLQGRTVFDIDAINNTEFATSICNKDKQISIVKVTLHNGKVISKKLIF